MKIVTLNGPEGFDTTGWLLALYDATTTELVEVTGVSDLYQMSPRISETTWVSLDRIIETVFLALVATSAGLLLAIPLSFLASRNLMRPIKSPMVSIAPRRGVKCRWFSLMTSYLLLLLVLSAVCTSAKMPSARSSAPSRRAR